MLMLLVLKTCNYVSNLAYDRLLVEMCVQQVFILVLVLVVAVVLVEDLQICLKFGFLWRCVCTVGLSNLLENMAKL